MLLDHIDCLHYFKCIFIFNQLDRGHNCTLLRDQGGLSHSFFYLLLMQDARKYTGIVEDCCCDYETVDSLNGAVLHPLLQDLVKTPFFRYFKVRY